MGTLQLLVIVLGDGGVVVNKIEKGNKIEFFLWSLYINKKENM